MACGRCDHYKGMRPCRCKCHWGRVDKIKRTKKVSKVSAKKPRTAAERQAIALERIAAAMEKMAEKGLVIPWPITPAPQPSLPLQPWYTPWQEPIYRVTCTTSAPDSKITGLFKHTDTGNCQCAVCLSDR